MQSRTSRTIGPFEAFLLGFKVLGSELKWTGLKLLRALEYRQLAKRLDQEYRELGRLAEHRDPQDPKVEERVALGLDQVEFLKEELAHLEAEVDARRAQYVARRRETWNV